jgi:hypothetical protein
LLRNNNNNNQESNDVEEVAKIEKQGIKTTTIPSSVYKHNSMLIGQVMERLKSKFSLSSFFVLNQSTIQIIGAANVLDQVCDLIQKSASSIQTKAIEGINYEILSSPNLKEIIKYSLAEYQGLVYQIDVKNDLRQGQRGVLITYCRDVPELDSPNDSIFDEISRKIVSNVAYVEMDLTSQSTVLLSPEWKQFSEENLSEAVRSYNLTFTLSMWNLNGKINVLLVGKRDHVLAAKQKIENFLEAHKLSGKTIDLTDDNVCFFLIISSGNRNPLIFWI